jgi:hypothetical protein
MRYKSLARAQFDVNKRQLNCNDQQNKRIKIKVHDFTPSRLLFVRQVPYCLLLFRRVMPT